MSKSLEDLRAGLDRPLEYPEAESLREQADQAVDWLLGHLNGLSDHSVGRVGTRAELNALLAGPPPEEGEGFRQALAGFQDRVAPCAFRLGHPRFLAYMPSAPTFASVLGDLLCAGTNFFCGTWLAGSGPAAVELAVLGWFRNLLGLPAETRGLLTGGGSEANLTALVVAREPLSFEDRARAVLYVSEHRHASVDRAAKVIGFRPEQVRPVSGDAAFRMRPEALAESARRDRDAGRLPWAAVANAGATNTGAVDPLVPLAEVCGAERIWYHVDAAYGWSAALIPEGQAELAGIGRADSVTLDPHKWFAQPFEAGCLLVRDGRRLGDAFRERPDYLQDIGRPDASDFHFADHGLALSRRFRALKIWLSVRALGLGWFRALVSRCCRLAAYSEELLRTRTDFEVLCSRNLSVVCFRYRPGGRAGGPRDEERLDRLNLALVKELRETGRAVISSTRLGDRVALRLCFVNWRTTAGDVDEVVDLLGALGRRLEDGDPTGENV
jgi:glutamate/tyrosine decarboxylase-like PLP-dependent enzyme